MRNLLVDMDFTYNFNPFSGLNDEEIFQAIVPRMDIEFIAEKIKSREPNVIEFVGPKGRGKTLHLRFLKLFFPEFPIFFLDKNSRFDPILQSDSEVVFIDSIHHLSLPQRIKIYKTKKIVILTTHFTRTWEYRIAGTPWLKYNLKGIDTETLKKIVVKRIRLSIENHQEDVPVNDAYLNRLIKTYQDNYREILNHLYRLFQPKTQHE